MQCLTKHHDADAHATTAAQTATVGTMHASSAPQTAGSRAESECDFNLLAHEGLHIYTYIYISWMFMCNYISIVYNKVNILCICIAHHILRFC